MCMCMNWYYTMSCMVQHWTQATWLLVMNCTRYGFGSIKERCDSGESIKCLIKTNICDKD